jgi:zinc-binding alcohol dehydrogenase/oxidoreductase
VTVVMPRIFLKHLTVLGTAMGTPEEFGAMLDLYAEHGLKPAINKSFPLEDTASAMEYMEKGEGLGKIVLDVPA